MRRHLPLVMALVSLFSASARAEAPSAFQYNVIQSEGRGIEVCDNIFGSLLQDSNLYYLSFRPGLQPRDVLRGDYDGTMQFNASPGISVPFWEDEPLGFLKQKFPAMAAELEAKQMQPGKDYMIRHAHFDIDASNHAEDIYQLVLPHGTTFPLLFADDSVPQVRDALKKLGASYAFTLKSVNYLMVRTPNKLDVWQLALDHAKHNGAGPQVIVSHLCAFTQNENPPASVDRKLEVQQMPLAPGQNNEVKN